MSTFAKNFRQLMIANLVLEWVFEGFVGEIAKWIWRGSLRENRSLKKVQWITKLFVPFKRLSAFSALKKSSWN